MGDETALGPSRYINPNGVRCVWVQPDTANGPPTTDEGKQMTKKETTKAKEDAPTPKPIPKGRKSRRGGK